MATRRRGAAKRTAKRTPKQPEQQAAKKPGRPAHPPHMKRRTFYVDQAKLDEVKAHLGVATETAAIDAALTRLSRKQRVAATILAWVDEMRRIEAYPPLPGGDAR